MMVSPLVKKTEKIRDKIDKLVPYSDAKKWTQGMAEALDNRRSKVRQEIKEFCTEQKKVSRKAAKDEPEVTRVGKNKFKIGNGHPINSVTDAYSQQRHTRMMAAIETIEKDLEAGKTFTETLEKISFALGGASIKRGDRPGKKTISRAKKALEEEGIFEAQGRAKPIELVNPEELPFGRMFLMIKADADYVGEKITEFRKTNTIKEKFDFDNWVEFTLVEKRILEMPGKYLSKKSTPGMEIPPQLLKYTATMLESLDSIEKVQAEDPDSAKVIRDLVAEIRKLVNDPHSFPKKTAVKKFPTIDILLKRILKPLPATK